MMRIEISQPGPSDIQRRNRKYCLSLNLRQWPTWYTLAL